MRLFSVCLLTLGTVFRNVELLSVQLEELRRFGRMLARHVMEGHGRDVVGLALTYQSIVLEEILKLRLVIVGLGTQHLLGFGSRGVYMLALVTKEVSNG